ncbi:MAG: thioredoxin-disulfide reductase [Oscillospiraceae bacterium]|nr:thioredoxin-disulfide reductase [Oscillospiraceae bacterium]
MNMKRIYDLLVIGGGPGGYTAALYAARAGLSVAVLEKLSAGGQMALTDTVDNYPGFPEGIDGFSLGENMQLQAERFGAVTELAEVLDMDLSGKEKAVHTSEGTFWGKTVVISTGASPRKLGLPNEEFYTGKGLHYCAACDGMRYKGKTVAVLGGGDSAVADALALARIAEKVIIVHRRDTLRATKVYHQTLEEASNVTFLWNSEVTELLGQGKLSGIKLKHVQTGEETELSVDGVFVSIGREPSSGLVKNYLELDERGYIVAGENTATSLPGVYAVGDVRTKKLRQIVTAVADGAYAAYAAEEYIAQV